MLLSVCVCVCVIECDQVIFSENESSGTVTSPYYPHPYPLNVRCIYYIDGLHDKQNLEKVQLTITDIDIPRQGRRSVTVNTYYSFIKPSVVYVSNRKKSMGALSVESIDPWC